MKPALPKLTFVLGGSRCGKSRFAQELALPKDTKGPKDAVIFWATGTASDKEMQKRIAEHRKNRPRYWDLLEEPRDLLGGLQKIQAKRARVIVLDSLTTWAGNIFHRPLKDNPRKHLQAFLHALKKTSNCWIIVSDEVGMGIIPESPMGRSFKDFLGDANQSVAAAADAVYFVSAGIPLKIK